MAEVAAFDARRRQRTRPDASIQIDRARRRDAACEVANEVRAGVAAAKK